MNFSGIGGFIVRAICTVVGFCLGCVILVWCVQFGQYLIKRYL